jgi:hypothetical protein
VMIYPLLGQPGHVGHAIARSAMEVERTLYQGQHRCPRKRPTVVAEEFGDFEDTHRRIDLTPVGCALDDPSLS